MIETIITTIALAIALSSTPENVLLARATGWEAPRYLATEADAEAVASVIMYRSICRGQSVRDVLFAAGQFETAMLLDTDPVDMDFYLELADRALQWRSVNDLPVVASHFHSAGVMPYWADRGKLVDVPEAAQFYYKLDDCRN